MRVMPTPTTTALYGSLNAALNIALAYRVSQLRRSEKVSLGVGSSKALEVAVRTHGNSAEFVPLAVLMLLLAELCGGESRLLHALGGTLLLGRLLHVVGMPRRAPNPYRVLANVLTWGMVLVASGYVLVLRAGG